MGVWTSVLKIESDFVVSSQSFVAFLAPLTLGRVNIAATAVYMAKVR